MWYNHKTKLLLVCRKNIQSILRKCSLNVNAFASMRHWKVIYQTKKKIIKNASSLSLQNLMWHCILTKLFTYTFFVRVITYYVCVCYISLTCQLNHVFLKNWLFFVPHKFSIQWSSIFLIYNINLFIVL